LKIQNGKDVPLNQSAGFVPNVQGALDGWLQPMTFLQVVKTVAGFQVSESAAPVSFNGVWQPFTDRQLEMKPIGQRSWSWFMVHSKVALPLVPDDVVQYLGNQYRVMSVRDYALYGYFEYHLILDFDGSGPGVGG